MRSDFFKYTTFHLQKVCCPDLKSKGKHKICRYSQLKGTKKKKEIRESLKTYKVLLVNSTLGMEIDTN